MSTRKVDDVMQAPGMSGLSKSQVSGLCGELGDRVNGVHERELLSRWPYLWLDTTYLKARDG